MLEEKYKMLIFYIEQKSIHFHGFNMSSVACEDNHGTIYMTLDKHYDLGIWEIKTEYF